MFILFGLACCLLDPAGFAAAEGLSPDDNLGLGYLSAPSMSFGHILRPSGTARIPDLDSEGTWAVDVEAHWANLWDYEESHFLLDGEWWRFDTRIQHALSETVSVGISVPVLGRTGGFADGLIEGFHTTFGLPGGDREQFPRNQSFGEVTTDVEPRTIIDGDSWGLGDVGGFWTWRVSDGNASRPAVRLQMQVMLPTGDEAKMEGLGKPSAAIGAVASKRVRESPFLVFGGAGLFYSSAEDMMGIELNREEYSGLLGVEYQRSRSMSFVGQYLYTSPVAKDFYAFSKPCHELTAGCKWQLSDDTAVELAFGENLFTSNNSADFSAHLAWCRKY